MRRPTMRMEGIPIQDGYPVIACTPDRLFGGKPNELPWLDPAAMA